jgi:GR25 family glycosyltransferase involved in LPS biosynthesis
MVLTDYFDGTYCINLNRRPDRWEDSLREFNKHGLNVERFEAVDGAKLTGGYAIKETVKGTGDITKGVMGCALSHLGIVEEAKARGLKTVLVLEDDVCFDDKLNEKFFEWVKEMPGSWDMLYLGGNHNARYATGRVSPHLLRITNTNATHAYALRDTVFDAIIERLRYIDFPVDIIYKEIQRKVNSYCFSPRLAWQREGMSDVLNIEVNYSFIRDNDGFHGR